MLVSKLKMNSRNKNIYILDGKREFRVVVNDNWFYLLLYQTSLGTLLLLPHILHVCNRRD